MAKVFKIMQPVNSFMSRTLYIESLSTELYVIDRADKQFISEHSEDLSKPALYILVNRYAKKLYVGKTGDSLERLNNHKSKDFWTEAIVYHSNPGTDTLSTTEVEWLEAKTYDTIKELSYYDLSDNKQKPKYPRLKRDQEINCPEYFEAAKNYICAAGFDIFLKRKQEDEEESKPAKKKDRRPPFKFWMAGLKPGDKVVFKPTGETVKVISDNTIEYDHQIFTLSHYCKVYMPDSDSENKEYQGPAHFTYNGRTLDDIRKEREKK